MQQCDVAIFALSLALPCRAVAVHRVASRSVDVCDAYATQKCTFLGQVGGLKKVLLSKRL